MDEDSCVDVGIGAAGLIMAACLSYVKSLSPQPASQSSVKAVSLSQSHQQHHHYTAVNGTEESMLLACCIGRFLWTTESKKLPRQTPGPSPVSRLLDRDQLSHEALL